jgi:hypothetical protein
MNYGASSALFWDKGQGGDSENVEVPPEWIPIF